MSKRKVGAAEEDGRDGKSGKDINKEYLDRGDKAKRKKKGRKKRGRG